MRYGFDGTGGLEMKGTILTAGFFALAALAPMAALSQTFDVASVKPAAPRSEGSRREGIEVGPGSLTLRNIKTEFLHQVGVSRF